MVVFQFAISIGLIISTLVMNNQLSYVKHSNVGFKKDFVLITPIFKQAPHLKSRYQTLKHAFLQHPNVLNVSASHPTQSRRQNIFTEGDPNNKFEVKINGIDSDFLKTFEL